MAALDLTLIGLNADEVSVRLGPGRTGEAGWSASKNTRFSARVLESVRGEAEIYPGGGPSGAAIWARGAGAGAQPWILYVTASGIGSFDGAHRNHTPAGWVTPRASQISTTNLNGRQVLNAPPNPPYEVVQGGGVATVIPGWPVNTHCFTMTGFRYYLVAGGVYGPTGIPYESLVMWSDAAEPGALPTTWTPLPTNDAGDLSMADFAGPLLAAHVLGDVLLFYKRAGVFALAWVGGQAVMGRRVVFPKRGVVCGQAAVMLEREHVVATAGDLMVHDGAQLRSLVEGRFRRYFATRVHADVWEQVRMAHDVTRGEVWCAYPLAIGGPLLEALVWSVADDTVSVRELPPSNDIFYTQLIGARRKWSEQRYGWIDAGGRQWSDVSTGADAAGVSCCVETPAGSKFVHLDSSNANSTRTVFAERVGIGVTPHGRRKLFKLLRPRIEGEVGSVIDIQVGAHDEVGMPVSWDAPRAFTIGTDESVPCLAAGRYAAARFTGSGRWRIEGLQLEWDVMGQY